MTSNKFLWIIALTIFATLAGAAVWWVTRPGQPVSQLSRLSIDPQRVAVVGFSSGAAMAQQLHLAYSDHLIGAVLLAGPPYQCAEGSLELALSRCMKAEPDAPDAQRLARVVEQRARTGTLAPLVGLAGDHVMVLHGRQDALVAPAVARAALALYEALPVAGEMTLRWDGEGDFAHVWPTLDRGGDCDATASPYMGRCGRDLAGEAMQFLFGAPRRAPAAAVGELQAVAMNSFEPDGTDAYMDLSAYFYRPPQCTAQSACGLLIAFHGCEQEHARIGDTFAREAGFNRWADAHAVVVLYPQARSTYMPLNPKACWDWWGYSGPDYDTRNGRQLRAVAAAAAALGAPFD